MSDRPEMTTASALGKFRSELLDVGFSDEEAFALSRDALNGVMSEVNFSLVVRGEVEVS